LKITDIQRRILEAARGAGGRYRLRARQPATEAKLEREACESFVAGDYARWISFGQTPGIVFTDKALRLYKPKNSTGQLGPTA
jgi:hypothetical protein